MSEFTFEPAPWIPMRDKQVLEYCRSIRRADMEKHKNPDFHIHIVLSTAGIMTADMVQRMKASDERNEHCVMILPNPAPATYQQVALLVNQYRINCRNVHLFAMDEWADEDGNLAPATYPAGFSYSMMKYLVHGIDASLRMPENQVHCPTNATVNDYTQRIIDAGEGGADVCYSGPGWAGHIAFIDPNAPEFAAHSLEEFCDMGARIVTLHPLTVAQNSLHGCFGQSGDLGAVPPKAFTIGPKDVKLSRNRLEFHDLTTGGSFSSWQRMTSRLVLYGPVTPLVPASILQQWPTEVYVGEEIAKEFDCFETVGY